MLHGTAKGHMA